MANDAPMKRRLDGKFEERLGEDWVAEYFEVPDTGLWRVEVFRHDVPEWAEDGLDSLEHARRMAREYWSRA
jgi:hypothetical protein